ncbi:MAG: glycosyltransferase, partial [Ruminococcus sp.]|nr:glycosyltransferase [Ruminococcus sp.]
MTDLARSLFNQGMTVVIVNDGSGALYNEIFERAELFAHVVRCTRNGGKGAALKTGLAYISDHFAPPYTVTTADADGQHAEEDILRVTRKAETRPDTLVIGS